MLGIKNYGRGYVFLMPGRTVLGFVPVAGYPMLRGNPEFPSGSLAKSQYQDLPPLWYQSHIVANLPQIHKDCDCLWWLRPGADFGQAGLGIPENPNGLTSKSFVCTVELWALLHSVYMNNGSFH